MVIAIIAILAAILFPVFAKAREKARQASCLSNMKQLALGALQYVQDYDEQFPYCRTANGFFQTSPITGQQVNLSFSDLYYPYIKNSQVFRCPSDATARPTMAGTAGTNQILVFSYGRNLGYFNGGKTHMGNQFAMGLLVQPAETIMMFDASCARPGARYQDFPADGRTSVDLAMVASATGPIARHNDGANFNFYDGHAKWFKVGAVPARMYSLEAD